MENSENKLTHGTIYKLSDNEGHFYFGSTINTLRKRFKEHKYDSKRMKTRIIYETFTYEKFCENKIKIEVVEEIVIENKSELRQIENQYIVKYRNDLMCFNELNAYITEEEVINQNKIYRDTHKEQLKEYQKKYDKQHREQIKEYKKEYDKKKILCECGLKVSLPNILRHKRSQFHQNFINTNPM